MSERSQDIIISITNALYLFLDEERKRYLEEQKICCEGGKGTSEQHL